MFRHSAQQSGCPKNRSEEHTSELQSHSEISYAVFCLKKKNIHTYQKLNLYITLTALLSATIDMMLLRLAAMYYHQVYKYCLGHPVLHTTRSPLSADHMAMHFGAFGIQSRGGVIN